MSRPSLPSRALLLFVAGCSGPAYDEPSLVNGLRVLAVRPEPASGAPGETVTLEMLSVDGKPRATGEAPRPVELVWLGGCHNPEGRLYYGCFPFLSSLARELSDPVVETPPDALPPGSFAVGSTLEMPLPDDILSSAPVYPGDPVHFGISFAFFAACAGELRPRPARTDRVPLACVDPESGAELGSGDFVQGFATLPTFDGARNLNPELVALRFDSLELVDEECSSDEECDGLAGADPGRYACSESSRCAPVVAPCDGDDDCSRYLVFPEIDESSAEPLAGEDAREIVWANFYATEGDFQTAAQLVNDRATGFIDDHGAYWVAPDVEGTIRVDVTVHDERGGADWASFEVVVRH
jgi:hypothetical protein